MKISNLREIHILTTHLLVDIVQIDHPNTMIAWPLSTLWHEYEYPFSVRKLEHRDRYFVFLPPGGKFPDDSGITSRELGWDGQFFTSVPSWLLAWSNPAIIIYPCFLGTFIPRWSYSVSVNCGGSGGGPMITEDIGNMTVALGREATLKCVVTHLSDYKV